MSIFRFFVCLFLLVLTSTSFALEDGEFTYEMADDGLEITGCLNSCPAELNIPQSIDGQVVTRVASWAFMGKSIESVIFPETLISIGDSAFMYNSIEVIDFPENIQTIGYRAFYQNMISNVTFPDSIILIGGGAFSSNNISSLNFNEGLKTIGSGAFSSNDLTSISFPSTLERIESNAFIGNNLEHITFPLNLSYIGESAFMENRISSIHFNGDRPYFDSNSANSDGNHFDLNYLIDSITYCALTHGWPGNPIRAIHYETRQNHYIAPQLDETCDFDGDGVSNSYDAFPLNSLYSFDSDADGIPDSWEILYGLNPYDPNDVDIDQDNDGIPSWQEYIDGTFPVSDRTLDIDANGDFDALTDGLIILRYAFGMRGDSLIDGVIANEAMRTTPFNIETFIANLLNLNEFESVVLDFDFNGSFDALTDGLIILRYAFGMRGDSLVDGVISEDAMRISATDVEAYIYSLLQLNIVEFKNNNVVITDYINGSFSNPVQHTINGVHDGGTTLVADLVDAKLDYQNLKQILDNDGTGTPLDMSFELSNLPAGSGSTSVNLRIFNGDDVIQDSNEDYLQVALIANWESDGDTIQIELPAYSNLVATFFDRGGTTLGLTITNMSADVITATKQGPNRPHSLEMRLSKLLSAFPSEVNGLSTFLDSSEIFTYQVEFGNFTLYDDLENPFTKIQGTFAVGEAEIAP